MQRAAKRLSLLVSFAFVFIFVIFLYSLFFRYKVYEVTITKPVTGLTVSSPVEFNGVNVGHIGFIKFNSKNPNILTVYLHLDKNVPITRGTVGKIELSEQVTEKLTGFPYTYISLHDDGKDPRPSVVLPGTHYPTITMSTDVNVTPSLTKMANAIQQYNAVLMPLLSSDNVESLKELIFSLQQLTAVFAKESNSIDTFLANSGNASKKFEPLLNSTSDTLLTLKTETLPQVYNMTVNANETLESVQRLLGKINNNPSIIVRGEALPKLGPGETEKQK